MNVLDIAVLAVIALSVLLGVFKGFIREVFAIIGVIAGVGLAVWAARLFAHAGTGVKPFTPSTTVVQTGPYQFTRNPMYLGMMIVLAGAFVLFGSLSPILVIAVFFWWIHHRFVLPEEDHMEHALGQAFLDYKESVRRWL